MGWFVSNGKGKIVTGEVPELTVKDRLRRIEISGHSRMADPGNFYQEMTRELENYFESFKHTLILDFRLEYINTGSSKWIYQMLSTISQLIATGGTIQVLWHYEEDDEVILQAGEILQSSLDMDFRLVEIAE